MDEQTHTLELTTYERDNLRAALLAIGGFGGPSALQVLNTGDWLMQVGYKIDPLGENGTEGRPNYTATKLVEMANERYARRYGGHIKWIQH